MLNKFHAIGRLTRDPELRRTASGKSITHFALALSESWKGDDGEWRENVVFTEWNIWNGSGENLCKLAHKGDLLYAEGKFSLDSWEDKNTGEKRSSPRFTALNWKLLTKKGESSSDKSNDGEAKETAESTKKRGRQAKVEKKQEVEEDTSDDTEDDVPF